MHLLDEHEHDHQRHERAWRGAAVVALLGSLITLLLAGNVLADASLGAAVAAASCSGTPLVGILLLLGAGAALGFARIAFDHLRASEVHLDLGRMWVASVPATVLLLSLPGFLGCPAGLRVARWPLIGDALVGAAGFTLAGASAFGLGLLLTFCVRLRVPAGLVASEHARLEQEAAHRPYRHI